MNDNHAPDKTGEELYRLYLDGDSDAFEALVRLYEHDFSLFIVGIVHNLHEAKHIVIEAFAQLSIYGNFEGRSSLKTYLYTIGKNLAMRHMRMRSREAHIAFEDVLENVLGESETPETFLQREESKRLLYAAMRDLKSDHRAVLHLLYFEDMSYLEAGRVMKKSERQIEGLACRAKAALKRTLESGGFTYV